MQALSGEEELIIFEERGDGSLGVCMCVRVWVCLCGVCVCWCVVEYLSVFVCVCKCMVVYLCVRYECVCI